MKEIDDNDVYVRHKFFIFIRSMIYGKFDLLVSCINLWSTLN